MGITLDQLEAEFHARIFELAEFCVDSSINDRVELATAVTIYLTEVVKRFQTPGLTANEIVEKSTVALDRRMRKLVRERGINELRELLEGGPDDHTLRDREAAEPSGVRPREKGKDKEEDGRHGPRDARPSGVRNEVPEGVRNEVPEGDKNGEPLDLSKGTLGGDGAARADQAKQGRDDGRPPPQGNGPVLPGPSGPDRKGPETAKPRAELSGSETKGHDRGSERDKRKLVMIEKTCPKCGASLGPELSDPRDPDASLVSVRPCPACGWNPKAVPEVPRKKKKSKSGPQPPRAGKAFTRS